MEEDDSDVEEQGTGKATPSVLCGYEAYKKLNVTRYRVRGDGSCWVYAILACLRLLEHHDEKRLLTIPRRVTAPSIGSAARMPSTG